MSDRLINIILSYQFIVQLRMLTSSLDLQRNYLQSLLEAHATRALEAVRYVNEENQKYQNQIAQGKLLILQGDEISPRTNHIKLRKQFDIYDSRDLNGFYTQRYSKSNRQSPQIKVISKEQHGKVLRHIIEQKRALNLQKQARRKQLAIEAAKQEAIRKQLFEELKLEKQIEKKRHLEERINLIHQKKEKRNLQIKEQNKAVEKLLHQNKLYKRLQKNYLNQVAATIEQKKKKLAEIRSFYKPITKEDLIQHQKKISMLRQRIPRKTDNQNKLRSSSLVEVYKSNFYKKALQESKDKTHEAEKEKEHKLQQAFMSKEKIKQYHNYIKVHFKPHIDDRLVQQLQNQNHVEIRKALAVEDLKQIGQDYLKFNLANKKQKQKPISEPVQTTKHSENFDISKDQSQERDSKNHHLKKAANTERLQISKQSKQISQQYPSRNKQSQDQIQLSDSRNKQINIHRRRSKSQIQADIRHIRRKQQDLNDIMDETQLDKLYEKILNVKMSIDKKA